MGARGGGEGADGERGEEGEGAGRGRGRKGGGQRTLSTRRTWAFKALAPLTPIKSILPQEGAPASNGSRELGG
jgi:hypothetical protein